MHELSGDEHSFHVAVYYMICTIMLVIVCVACTFKFEKHCA
jgi:hypothetical protein|eukprot:COSAG01_NODE_2929_length_6838_cov_12.819855_1_plen_41_part_00